MEYLIEVDVRFTRTYTVTAVSPEQALEIYQTGTDFDAISEPDDLDLSAMEEQGDTAAVFTNDVTRTLLLDAADFGAEGGG
jgi:hypothetical protein